LNDRQNILKEIKQSVISIDENAEVILFGSRARGDYHDESDWDVLVLIDKEQSDWRFKQKLMSALYETELEWGQIITPIIRNKKFWQELQATSLFKEVEKDGVKI